MGSRESTSGAAGHRVLADSRSSRRTRCVWALFAASMTAVGGVLVLLDGSSPRPVLASTTTALSTAERLRPDSVVPSAAPFDRERWTSIVVHHSGLPAGNAASIERHQLSAGITPLGYHFVIGNGHGLGDGEIHVGHRWTRQLPGAHLAMRPRPVPASGSGVRPSSLDSASLARIAEHSIGICLVGNGDRNSFTPRQIRELVSLVTSLQRELGISATEIYLHRDLALVSSPGDLFPSAEFESQLLR